MNELGSSVWMTLLSFLEGCWSLPFVLYFSSISIYDTKKQTISVIRWILNATVPIDTCTETILPFDQQEDRVFFKVNTITKVILLWQWNQKERFCYGNFVIDDKREANLWRCHKATGTSFILIRKHALLNGVVLYINRTVLVPFLSKKLPFKVWTVKWRLNVRRHNRNPVRTMSRPLTSCSCLAWLGLAWIGLDWIGLHLNVPPQICLLQKVQGLWFEVYFILCLLHHLSKLVGIPIYCDHYSCMSTLTSVC